MFIPFKQNVSRECHLQPLLFFHCIGGDKLYVKRKRQENTLQAFSIELLHKIWSKRTKSKRKKDPLGRGRSHFLDMLLRRLNQGQCHECEVTM